MVTYADPEGRGIEGSQPLLANQKFYGFLELAFRPPPPPPPGKSLTPLENCLHVYYSSILAMFFSAVRFVSVNV